jgi:chromosome segregation ATPase
MQPESSTPESAPESVPATAPEIKKTSKFNVVTLFLVILVLAAIGLGVWGYTLNTNIQTTYAERDALQKKYDGLMKDKNGLAAELETAKTELATAQSDLKKAQTYLTDAQGQLTKSQDEATKLQASIDNSLKYLNIALGVYVHGDDLSETESKVKVLNDPKLTEKFKAYKEKDNEKNFTGWMSYLFATMADLIKVK